MEIHPVYVGENGVEYRYLIAFIDDRSRRILYYELLQNKEAATTAASLIQCIQAAGDKIGCIWTDNGREFINAAWDAILINNSIIRARSRPYTAYDNARLERWWKSIRYWCRDDWSMLPIVVFNYNHVYKNGGLFGKRPDEVFNNYMRWHVGDQVIIKYVNI